MLRERKRIPPSRVRPGLPDRKAGIIQQRAKCILAELVAVLGMDGFKGHELNAKLCGRDIHALITRAFQVHLDA